MSKLLSSYISPSHDSFFFFNDTATTEIYTLSLHDALPISGSDWRGLQNLGGIGNITIVPPHGEIEGVRAFDTGPGVAVIDRKSTRLNSITSLSRMPSSA